MQNDTEGRKGHHHRGVSVTPLLNNRWRVRWREPGGRAKERIIKGAERKAIKFAVWQAGQLRQLRDKRRQRKFEISMGLRVEALEAEAAATAPKQTVKAEATDFYLFQSKEKKHTTHALLSVERGTLMLLRWCDAHGITYLEQLTKAKLLEFRSWLLARRRPTGAEYQNSTVNLWMKPVRTMLRRASNEDRTPLSHGAIAIGLARVSEKESKQARVLDVAEIRALLEAALEFDRRDRTLEQASQVLWAHRPVAPDIAVLLLTGLRRREYTFMRCAWAQPHKVEGPALHVDETIAKGGRARPVYFRGFSNVGAELIAQLVNNRDQHSQEWLSMWEYDALGRALKRLIASYGAPKCSLHDLRATCSTYQAAVKGVDINRACDRLGHGATVQRDNYWRPPAGMVFNAKTLEHAMGAVPQFQAVLRALQRYEQTPRTERRPLPLRLGTQALASPSAQVLADALYPRGTTRPAPVPVAAPEAGA